MDSPCRKYYHRKIRRPELNASGVEEEEKGESKVATAWAIKGFVVHSRT